jgi:hypothetical protein
MVAEAPATVVPGNSKKYDAIAGVTLKISPRQGLLHPLVSATHQEVMTGTWAKHKVPLSSSLL